MGVGLLRMTRHDMQIQDQDARGQRPKGKNAFELTKILNSAMKLYNMTNAAIAAFNVFTQLPDYGSFELSRPNTDFIMASNAYPHITLYRANGACSFAPHALLRDLSIPFDSVVMKMGANGLEAADGSQSSEEYRKIHHLGYVAAMRLDNDVVITESPAILTYIASLAPERQLLGKTAIDQAKAMEWMTYLSGSLHILGFGMLYKPGRFTDDESKFEAIKERGRGHIRACYSRIDGLLKGREYPVGDDITAVDFNLVHLYYWGVWNGIDMDAYPNYGSLVDRMEKRESVREAARLEGKKLVFG